MAKKKQKRVLSPHALEVLRRTAAYARQVREQKREERKALGLEQPYKKPVKAEPKPTTKAGAVVLAPVVDLVNHPSHYKVGGIETIDFIEAKQLNYNLGNVVKYLTRADHKGNRKQDLEKAQWYLAREISTLS